MRKVVYAELGQVRRQVLHQWAFEMLRVERVKISDLASQVVSA
jgi:hypothetical protein